MWDLLKSIFLEFEVADRYASKRYRKLRNKCSPQMDSEHMRKLRKRDYLKQSAVKTNNELDWLNYRNARNKVNIAVKAAKSNRPFPNYLWPLFQSESWCSSFHMKISFHSNADEN